MALNINTLYVTPEWTLLNDSDAVNVQLQNVGTETLQITRGTTDAPAIDAPFFLIEPKYGRDPMPIADVLLAPTGGRIWARATGTGRMTITWETA